MPLASFSAVIILKPCHSKLQQQQPPQIRSRGIGRGRRWAPVVRVFLGGAKSSKGCSKCKGKGSLECQGCQGTGKNKKNGNIFERWKCYDCQGFGLVSCPNCGRGGLTPEQRGER
ncbi:hypothetical protein O6H91_08G099900 [Diphasiastrum complanatum]|uniref:Uncharacterized protein n=1 Tax=Diphasiastrum complanatum TaxID=34168 RepID=A0ACC2D0I8_DIPCM|nr:hypothetical protein O6H91_08G099900 [Diphasiastrum complanatum]